jgi:hypothetical protein
LTSDGVVDSVYNGVPGKRPVYTNIEFVPLRIDPDPDPGPDPTIVTYI